MPAPNSSATCRGGGGEPMPHPQRPQPGAAHLHQNPYKLPLTEQTQEGKERGAALVRLVGQAGLGLLQRPAQSSLPLCAQGLQGLPLQGDGAQSSLPQGPQGPELGGVGEPPTQETFRGSTPWLAAVEEAKEGASLDSAQLPRPRPNPCPSPHGRQGVAHTGPSALTACSVSLVSDGAFSTDCTWTLVVSSICSCCWKRSFRVCRGRCSFG